MQVYNKRNTRLHERDRSVIGEFARRLSLTSGKAIRKAEIKYVSNYKGINAMTKMRTGTFMFTNQLGRTQVLPNTFRDKCVCFNTTVVENAECWVLLSSS